MDRNRVAIMRAFKWGGYGILLIPFVFLLIFYFYPLLSILQVSIWQDGINSLPNLSGFVTLATDTYYLKTIWFTVWQAAASTVLTLALALPAAYVFVRYQFVGKSTLLSLSTLPFVLPTVVVAAAFMALIGRDGVVNVMLMTVFDLETRRFALSER